MGSKALGRRMRSDGKHLDYPLRKMLDDLSGLAILSAGSDCAEQADLMAGLEVPSSPVSAVPASCAMSCPDKEETCPA